MKEKSAGKFFAVGKREFGEACRLGLNASVALLVLACGSSRNNSDTTWSAEAIRKYTGMTWRRARVAIGALEATGLLSTKRGGARPIRKISINPANDGAIWLPSELVCAAKGEVPLLARLREAQNPTALSLLIELYGEQELTGDGGIPRSIIRGVYQRKLVCSWGPYEVYGFLNQTLSASPVDPLLRHWNTAHGDKGDGVWPVLNLLIDMGVLEIVPYLAESESYEAELIHPIGGDTHANEVSKAASALVAELPGKYKHQGERFDFIVPVLKHVTQATMVDVFRLKYRPKTKRTAAWYAHHVKSCEGYAAIYKSLAASEFKSAAVQTSKYFKGFQSQSKTNQGGATAVLADFKGFQG